MHGVMSSRAPRYATSAARSRSAAPTPGSSETLATATGSCTSGSRGKEARCRRMGQGVNESHNSGFLSAWTGVRLRRLALSVAIGCLIGVGATAAATIPDDVLNAVHGRVVGWARSGSDWFVVYLDRTGGDWCGMRGASWRIALAETESLPVRVTADRRLEGAMCGNALAWVRAGRFSDGKHTEAAFMLWTTPSI